MRQADALVAAVADTHQAVSCTGDVKGFPMSPLRLEHWPVGQ